MSNRSYMWLSCCAAALPSMAYAQFSLEAPAGAEIIDPLSIMAWEEMEFGTIAPSATQAGTVTLSPAGERTCDALLTCFSTFRAGKFSVMGEEDAVYSISMPSSFTIANGASTMTVSGVTPSQTNGVLMAGYDEFMVGATLSVAPNQPTGAYLGSYLVTVEYQ